MDQNTKLVLAAPDMFAALKAINDRLNDLALSSKKPHTNDLNDFKRWAAAAIAKASA